jgi:hypothetical protein
MKTKPETQIKDLVAELVELHREYWELAFDKKPPTELGPPAKPAQIAKLEKILGKPLPPSYRAFLELHNGWAGFDGDGKLLAVEDQGSEWVKEQILLHENAFDGRAKSPFEKGMMPVMIGESIRNYMVLDQTKLRDDGEMEFLAYDSNERVGRYKDFAALLRAEVESSKLMSAELKKGKKKRAKR